MHDVNLLVFFDEIKRDLLKIFNNVEYGIYYAGVVLFTFETKEGTSHKYETDLSAIDNGIVSELVTWEQVKLSIIQGASKAVFYPEGDSEEA